MLTPSEAKVLRNLAQQYMEYACANDQEEKKTLWKALNGRRMQRPMIMIDQLPWNEMNVDGSLTPVVEDPYWRAFEAELRRTLYKCRHLSTDLVLPKQLCLLTPVVQTDWGVKCITSGDVQTDASSDIHSRQYTCQFESIEDVEKLQMPTVRRDVVREALLREEAHYAFDGVAPFLFSGSTGPMSMNLTLWDTISEWMGVSECYYALYDDPEMLHAMLRRMTDGMLGLIDQMNDQGLFDITLQSCHCTMTFDDALPGADADPEHAQSRNAWAFGQAQLFSSASPKVTEEFELPYVRQLYARFGAGYYGCCERLDDRLDVVAQIPNVRKISCSPWSHCESFAEQVAHRFVMSCKPNPAVFATDSFDLDYAREELRRLIRAARTYGADVELILKDVSTIRYEPQRLWDWSRMAMEEVAL